MKEEVESLVAVINQVSKQEDGMALATEPKSTASTVIELINLIGGGNVNPGILRECSGAVTKKIFEGYFNLVVSESDYGTPLVYAVNSNDKLELSITCDSCNNQLNVRVGKTNYYGVDNSLRVIRNEEIDKFMKFDEDGIELERNISVLCSREQSPYLHGMKLLEISAKRDEARFDIVHVEQKGVQNGVSDQKLMFKLYSLSAIEGGKDITDPSYYPNPFIHPDEFRSVDYTYFPQLRELVESKMNNEKRLTN